jgi:nucleobase:cation symporter-1, NCS1 family
MLRPRAKENSIDVEKHGIDAIPAEDRHGKASSQFTIRFAPAVYLAPMVIGVEPINEGIGLLGAVSALVLGNLLAGIVVGLFSAMGPRLGMPQMAMGRMVFGFIGNVLPSFFSALQCLGYFSVGIALSAQALSSALAAPYWLFFAVVAVVSVLLTALGYKILHLVSRWVTVIGVAVFIVASIMALAHGLGDGASVRVTGGEYWLDWSVIFTLAFTFNGSWVVCASDYSRYLPAGTKRPVIVAYAGLGTALGYAWPMCLGALLAATTAGGHGDIYAGLRNALPGTLGSISILLLGIGSIPHNSVNQYGSVMAALASGIRLSRMKVTLIVGVIGFVFALVFGGARFESSFDAFLVLIGEFVMPWAAIMLVDHYWLRRKRIGFPKISDFYLKDGPFGRVRKAGIGSLIFAIFVSIPFMATDLYTGPIGAALHIDISAFVAFPVAAAVYYCAMRLSSLPVPHESKYSQVL